jgi:solute carrier family 25 2-oxodicarboxylate transporter 21
MFDSRLLFTAFIFLLQDSKLEVLRRLGIGFIAGTLGSICNIPFDVAKSRIQGPQPVPGQVKYKGTIKTIVKVYHEEG